jgi:hypothetical protein
VPILNLNEDISITKQYDASGLFDPGVVQYFMTYIDLYGRESKIFYQSPLYYTSMHNRGGMYSVNGDGTSNEECNNSFTITINNWDTQFDYIRVYSILRTTLNGQPQAKVVTDLLLKDNSTESIVFVDTNTTGYAISPTDIFFLGGIPVAASTIKQKDNTLFIGDLNYSSFS